MTGDERIEKALNRFGETLDGLPNIYGREDSAAILTESAKWFMDSNPGEKAGMFSTIPYACRLADIIEKLMTALETATRLIDCTACQNFWSCRNSRRMDNVSPDIKMCDDFVLNTEGLTGLDDIERHDPEVQKIIQQMEAE